MDQHSEVTRNQKFQEKGSGYYCWKQRKKERKELNICRNYSSRLARAASTLKVGRARALKDMFMRKLTKNQTYLEIQVRYLNNPSEENIFGSNN